MQDRAHKLQARRQDILTEISGFKRQKSMSLSNLTPKQRSAFSAAIGIKLMDRSSCFGKESLQRFVNPIKLTGKAVKISGSCGALAHGIAQMKTGTNLVPAFVPIWLPDLDSNQGHTD